MGDGVGFEEAGAGFIPLVGLDGDLVAQEGSGFGGGPASLFVFWFSEAFKFSEQADRMFAVIAEGSAEFIEDGSFFFTGAVSIALKDRFRVFPFRPWTHNVPSF